MTEPDLWPVILTALLFAPTDKLPVGAYPEPLRDALIAHTVLAGWADADERWDGWDVPKSVAWLRRDVLTCPPHGDMAYLPPRCVAELRYDHACHFRGWVKEVPCIPEIMSPMHQELLRLAEAEAEELVRGWSDILSAYHDRGRNRLYDLKRLRDRFPRWYYRAWALPAVPTWRVRLADGWAPPAPQRPLPPGPRVVLSKEFG